MSQEQIQIILERLSRIEQKLDQLEPVAKTYETAGTIGRWAKAFLVFVSIVLGVIVGLKNIFK